MQSFVDFGGFEKKTVVVNYFVDDVHLITQRAHPRKKVKRERQTMKAR